MAVTFRRVLAVVCAASLGASLARAEPPASAPARTAVPGDAGSLVPQGDFTYLGADSCRNCHTQPLPDYVKPDKEGRRTVDFVCFNEYKTWKEIDRHSLAYESLKNARSKRMAEILEVDVTSAEAGCINCHALNPPESTVQSPFGRHAVADGVTCESCHGPASAWLQPHFTQRDWRTLSAAEKAKVGFIDVRDAEIEARLCTSCHVGNAAEGKIVTHEMYAAGHPPLPSVEPHNLALAMPRHWRLLAEKPAWIREQFKYEAGDQPVARTVVLGSVIAYDQSLQLLMGRAASDAPWPEFAVFDCYACHHDLKRKSWRQERGYVTRPGRPTFRSWPDALPRATLLALGNSPTVLDEPLGSVYGVLAARPFGDPQKVAAVTAGARDRLDADLLTALRNRTWDEAFSHKLLAAIIETGSTGTWDFDSARQLAWGFKSILEELQSNPEELGDRPGDDPASPLACRKLPAAPDAGTELGRLLIELDALLVLEPTYRPTGEPQDLDSDRMLKALADYDPARFRTLFRRAKGHIPPTALSARP